MAKGYVKVATVDGLSSGKLKCVKVGNEEVCIINTGSSIVALSNICTHAGCELADNGEVDGEELECGCHGSRFKLATGEVTGPPARVNLKRFDVRIQGNDILISVSG
ncbi:MAG: hypothetical protein EXR53_01885 [Dehalococcoidia bacterium]|nr:hypothetical protein [Dehalococcoidia bacterium]